MFDNQQQPPDMNAWFNEVGNASPTQQPPAQKPQRRLLLVILGGIGILIAGLVITLIIVSGGSSTCLTKDDYYDLTGIRYADALEPKTGFYTDSLYFKADSVDFSDPETEALIKKLGTFYTTHAKKPIIFTIDSSYESADTLELIQSRINNVTESLQQAGVPEAVIRQSEPLLYTPEEPEEAAAKSEDLPVTITVISAESCK